MGSFGDYLEDALINHITGKTAFTMLGHLYVALSTADPTDDASGMAEPSSGSYARVETHPADWAASSGGATSNSAIIEFPESTGSWGNCTHFAIFDADTVGNMLGHGQLTAARNVSGAGFTPRFKAGELDISLT
jgi:hypothetical protein